MPADLATRLFPLLWTLALSGCAFVVEDRRWNPQSTQVNLFFGQRQGRGPLRKRSELPDDVLLDLCKPSVRLPFNCEVQQTQITIRNLRFDDIDAIVPMCVQEFGSPPIEFPWRDMNRKALSDWFDSNFFGLMVRLSLFLKIQCQQQGDITDDPDHNFLILETQPGRIHALVEISREPIDAERNPPPLPLPTWFKELYASSKPYCGPPNGWVSNLLVIPESRGKGYSKLLMVAAEGVAKSWNCSSITLHVSSDSVGGRIPQSLYSSLGYEALIVPAQNKQYEWMGIDTLKSGLYVVEGVPLLCLQKQLADVHDGMQKAKAE